MLVVRTGNFPVGEHLVDVHVHGHTRPSSLSTGHEVLPVVETSERVVDQHDGVALQIKMSITRIHPPGIVPAYLLGGSSWEPNASIRVIPVLLDRRHHLIVEPSGLVERSNDGNDRRVAGELGSEGLDDSVRTSNSVILRMPSWVINSMTRIVETILAPGGSMQVDNDL